MAQWSPGAFLFAARIAIKQIPLLSCRPMAAGTLLEGMPAELARLCRRLFCLCCGPFLRFLLLSHGLPVGSHDGRR